jgi:hypothetical protein
VPWLVYATVTIVLLALHPAFRAFRNLLPLAALATVLFGLLGAWIASRVARARAVIATGLLVLAALFLVAAEPHTVANGRASRTGRAEAVDWLASRGVDQPVLVMHELAVCCRASSRDWAGRSTKSGGPARCSTPSATAKAPLAAARGLAEGPMRR